MHRLFLSVLLTFFIASGVDAQEPYAVHYHLVNKDTATASESIGLRTLFSSKKDCIFYMENLVKNQKMLGFLTCSIDSVQYNAAFAEVWIFIGERYAWSDIHVSEEVKRIAEAAGVLHHFHKKNNFNDSIISVLHYKMINWLENNGYPFASIVLDSIQLMDHTLSGQWTLEKGPLYKIDRLQVEGHIKLSTHFLEQYLNLPIPSIYRKDRLEEISHKLRELNFLEETNPWTMNLSGTGATVNLYLRSKPNNQVDALIGFLPSNQSSEKTIITGEVNVRLNNAIGYGETIGFNWQQLQVHSPRLNLLYQQPYIFRSAYGIDLQLDIFKKDSSFLNLNALAGLSFTINKRQRGKLFYQQFVSNQINVDTTLIKQTKQLPQQLDVRTTLIGFHYLFKGTDYAFNPRKGSEVDWMISAGIRKINRNSFIEGLKTDTYGQPFAFSALYDPLSLKSYALRLRTAMATFLPLGKQSTVKLALNAAMVTSKGVYRNEQFQIGGYKLLRGFNEETLYANRYMVTAGEYRYLIGQNAFFYAFTDVGWVKTVQRSGVYWGNGLGLSLETKGGILNLSYALGKQPNEHFSLRDAKIHFGFLSIF